MNKVRTGLDQFREGQWKRFKGRRLGLLCNQASVDANITPAKRVISEILPGHLKALFGPQHGHGGEDQDNMVETGHSFDKELNIPIFSLYGDQRAPLEEMLDLIDVLIIDLQDVGARVYTFASTMLNCMKAAKKAGKRIAVLDRPNPLGGLVTEGNLLRPGLFSFVGTYEMPMRHGLTMGEMALMFDHIFNLETGPEIIPMVGWQRHMMWHDTGLRWIMPSPNMPIPKTAHVYPGQVIWEGTNLSEGRGTCRPFEIFGAPFLDTLSIKMRLDSKSMEGCLLQDVSFRPTFNKWDGRLCRGFMIHIVDYDAFRPYTASIALLKAVIETHRSDFQWKAPPYEYEFERMPIDLILGDWGLRTAIENGVDIPEITSEWPSENREYNTRRAPYLLYN